MPDSVSQWLDALKGGDQAAARKLWNRYFQRLVEAARERVNADEEDLALDVFAALCRIARSGRLRSKNRTELWRLLKTITRTKSIDQYRREGRLPQADGGWWDDSSAEEEAPIPTPDTIAMLNDELQILLDRLPNETHRRIVQMKMQRYTNGEIAKFLGVAERTIERRLRFIREQWSEELG